jgi:hypothetical protein
LRGLALVDLGQLKVDALGVLLPRITLPPLSPAEVANMDPRIACGAEIGSFVAESAAHGCPRTVDDAMADVAVVFHWPPAAMEAMALSDLMGWRDHAARRSRSPEQETLMADRNLRLQVISKGWTG